MNDQGGTARWVTVVGVAFLALSFLLTLGVAFLVAVVFSDPNGGQSTCRSVAVSAGGTRVPDRWRGDLEDAAAESGVPVEVHAAMTHKETGFDEDAVNPVSGAAGMAQFMPDTWAVYGQGDPMDGSASLAAQGRYMGVLMDLARAAGLEGPAQIEGALAAYNWGPGNMDRVGWDWKAHAPNETQDYVPFIMGTAQVSYSEDCGTLAWDGDLGDGEWTTPLPTGKLISGYGARNIPGYPAWANDHAGIDLATPDGNGVVVAPMDMRVTAKFALDGCVLGKATGEVEFGLEFCHLDSDVVEVGDRLSRGDPVGAEGGVAGSLGGRSTEHLHFAMYDPAGPDPKFPGHQNPVIDPTPLLRAKGAL